MRRACLFFCLCFVLIKMYTFELDIYSDPYHTCMICLNLTRTQVDKLHADINVATESIYLMCYLECVMEQHGMVKDCKLSPTLGENTEIDMKSWSVIHKNCVNMTNEKDLPCLCAFRLLKCLEIEYTFSVKGGRIKF